MRILIDIIMHAYIYIYIYIYTIPGFNCSGRGRLVMKLRHGHMLVQTVRQSQRRTYTSAVGHEFRVTQLKQSNLWPSKKDPFFMPIPEDQDKHNGFKTPDVRYEIKHTNDQEVEVSIYISFMIYGFTLQYE